MTRTMAIGSHCIGGGMPCFVIAEAGVNHNGDIALALRLVDVAVEAGANAVKFQTFSAADLTASDAPKAAYQLETTDSCETQYAMLKRLELIPEAHRTVMRHCAERGIIFLSSPFDEAAADLLEDLGVLALKIPSGEIVNLPFLRYVARKRRPIILSTGMATMEEVTTAIETLREAGVSEIAALHCLSNYPADPAQTNLLAMATIAETCDLPVGFSDHTQGVIVALAAVALGASVIEKHLTLDRNLPGPDHRASLEPEEFAEMVRGIRTVEAALGDGVKRPQPSELENRMIVRKSVVAARDLAAGTVLTACDLRATRPGFGLSPAFLPELMGRRLAIPLRKGARIGWDYLA